MAHEVRLVKLERRMKAVEAAVEGLRQRVEAWAAHPRPVAEAARPPTRAELRARVAAARRGRPASSDD